MLSAALQTRRRQLRDVSIPQLRRRRNGVQSQLCPPLRQPVFFPPDQLQADRDALVGLGHWPVVLPSPSPSAGPTLSPPPPPRACWASDGGNGVGTVQWLCLPPLPASQRASWFCDARTLVTMAIMGGTQRREHSSSSCRLGPLPGPVYYRYADARHRDQRNACLAACRKRTLGLPNCEGN